MANDTTSSGAELPGAAAAPDSPDGTELLAGGGSVTGGGAAQSPLVVVDSAEVDSPVEALSRLATEEEIEAAIRRAVARISATNRLKVVLLNLTNRRDWLAHGAEGEEETRPYLTAAGAEKVIHAFGIEVEHDGGAKVQVDDGGYEFVYHGQMRSTIFSEQWFPVVGSRWSEDGFFTRGGKIRPDPGDVRKAALTNFYNRGIKTVCGLRNLGWDDLEKCEHLRGLRDSVSRIDYHGGGGGGAKSAPGERAALEQGPHIKVKLDYADETSKAAIKKLPPSDRLWNKEEKYWVVKWSKANFGMIADLQAANPAVKFRPDNVPAEELP